MVTFSTHISAVFSTPCLLKLEKVTLSSQSKKPHRKSGIDHARAKHLRELEDPSSRDAMIRAALKHCCFQV